MISEYVLSSLLPLHCRREPCLLLQPVLHGFPDRVFVDRTHPANTLHLSCVWRSSGQTGVPCAAECISVLHGGEDDELCFGNVRMLVLISCLLISKLGHSVLCTFSVRLKLRHHLLITTLTVSGIVALVCSSRDNHTLTIVDAVCKTVFNFFFFFLWSDFCFCFVFRISCDNITLLQNSSGLYVFRCFKSCIHLSVDLIL